MSSLSASDVRPLTGDLVASVQGVSVTYRTTFERRPTLKQAMRRIVRGRAVREVQALRDVSFDLHHGTTLGVIGHNGAGKSTLMRTLAGVLPPTEGRIELYGRVSTLLALGVGFNRALSGRDNVVLGGLAAGLTRDEVEQRFGQIADFAELGDFIDMPMRTYSAGMYSRLAFAVAMSMDPDILLIDEALSTGDARFKRKANKALRQMAASAHTMVLVSHGLGTIREMCNDVLWLDHGRVMMRGAPEDVIPAYTDFMQVSETSEVMEDM